MSIRETFRRLGKTALSKRGGRSHATQNVRGMAGQWLGRINGEFAGSIRIDLEDRGSGIGGQAYVFYEPEHSLPGFMFELHLSKAESCSVEVVPIYLYSDGGVMTKERRDLAEASLIQRFGKLPMPAKFMAHFSVDGPLLSVGWSTAAGETGSLDLVASDASGSSAYIGSKELNSWDKFRQWAVNQQPRNFIFRGQREPFKLSSGFHRTWRTDLTSWIANDVNQLYAVLAERVTYPLQLGKEDHNAALWSILQHHGYPTPLIDWTFSPFVAAYFAFEGVDPNQDVSPRIFMFDKAAWSEKYAKRIVIADAAPPQLVIIESMIAGNPRSAPQQALASVTNVADVEGFIRDREEKDGRTYLTVCDLPVAERTQIMRELELMGITYGSLFPGVDGICRDMKDRLFRPFA